MSEGSGPTLATPRTPRREPTWATPVREFAISIFDRLCVWTGAADRIEIRDDGGVTNIEHSARNLFGIVGEWCTIVRGD